MRKESQPNPVVFDDHTEASHIDVGWSKILLILHTNMPPLGKPQMSSMYEFLSLLKPRQNVHEATWNPDSGSPAGSLKVVLFKLVLSEQ